MTGQPARRRPLKRRQRIMLLSLVAPALIVAAALAVFALSRTAEYFYAPTDLPAANDLAGRKIRLGGMVVENSIRQGAGTEVSFDVTDFETTVTVVYDGVLPGLFAEGEGVVAQGTLGQDGRFVASRILAKHDETYMPPEVADSLKGNYGDYKRHQGESE